MARSPGTAAELIPPGATLDELREIAAGCTACDLHETGTRTVFGEGPADAEVIFVGEQPGDQEDQLGQPFVGPAGRELDRGLEAVGLGDHPHLRTNVVKHFKWKGRRGKRRIHAKPNRLEIEACLPWLEAEVAATRPEVIIALGSTAAQALLGRDLRVSRQRGELHAGIRGAMAMATVHPSSILRAGDDEDRRPARASFHADLGIAATLVKQGPEAALRRTPRVVLYRRAKELDVPGRSSMAKAELAGAVAAALAATSASE